MSAAPISALDRARAAWGNALPVWVEALARACDQTSQSEVARRLSYSPAVISTVLLNRYNGSLTRVETKVRGAFMDETVDCPVVGELAKDACAGHQAAPYANTNSIRIRLYRACRNGCAHATIARNAHAES